MGCISLQTMRCVRGSRIIRRPRSALFGLAVAVFFLVSITWIFFRAPNFEIASTLIGKLFSFQGPIGRETLARLLLVIVLGPVVSYFKLFERFMAVCEENRTVELVAYTFMLLAVFVALVTLREKPAKFIYFQF